MQSESQSNRAPGPRGACREAPPAGWNGAGFLPDGAEGNPASRRSRALHNQNVSPFQLRLRAQQDLAPRIDIMIHVANVLSNKATNHWAIGPLGRRYAKSAAETKPRSRVTITSSRRPPYSREISWPKTARGDARGRIRCPSPHAQSSSSAITIPERVFSFAAKSAATVKPRAQTRASPLANTG